MQIVPLLFIKDNNIYVPTKHSASHCHFSKSSRMQHLKSFTSSIALSHELNFPSNVNNIAGKCLFSEGNLQLTDSIIPTQTLLHAVICSQIWFLVFQSGNTTAYRILSLNKVSVPPFVGFSFRWNKPIHKKKIK